jgi:hypothetical protein
MLPIQLLYNKDFIHMEQCLSHYAFPECSTGGFSVVRSNERRTATTAAHDAMRLGQYDSRRSEKN